MMYSNAISDFSYDKNKHLRELLIKIQDATNVLHINKFGVIQSYFKYLKKCFPPKQNLKLIENVKQEYWSDV